MGLPGIDVAWLSSVVIYNLGDSIDSWAHIIGRRPFQETHKAGNHWLLGLLILGEGWHANHHAFPESARHGLLPRQWDWTWGVIRVLRLLRIAYDIHVPTDQTVSAKLRFQIEPASRVRL
jgi:stearoyl-CoA desaturase (delta-9 desaturase)